MATSMSMSAYSGYPTETSMRVNVSFSVTYEGTYQTYFELYDDWDDLIDDAWGSEFVMSANSSKSGIYKTFSGLEPGSSYYIVGSLWNAKTGVRLSISEPVVYFTTKSVPKVTVNYYDGSKSDSESSTSSITVGGPLRTDWDFVGWSTSTSSTSISYEEGDRISVGSSNKTVNLYAVYRKDTTIYCYFIDGSTGEMDSNSRTKTQYRCNTSKTASSTNFYNTITLPNFTSVNATIKTTDPIREWSAIGWRQDRTAASASYSGGQSVASNLITANLYAVYSNNCTVTYNSNGGSGNMTGVTMKAYYSASYTYTTPEIPINSCAFTPPTGKTFSHWNTAADGSGTTYSGSIATNYVVTLYAIWREGRPDNWSWPTHASMPIVKGADMRCTGSGTNIVVKPLTASEWLDFADRIQEFYTYKGVTINSTYWYRTVNGVSSGSPMTATQVNGARYLINQLSPPTAVPAAISSGSTITAAFINGLKNSLNSIK